MIMALPLLEWSILNLNLCQRTPWRGVDTSTALFYRRSRMFLFITCGKRCLLLSQRISDCSASIVILGMSISISFELFSALKLCITLTVVRGQMY